MGEILSILKNDEQYNNSYKEGLISFNYTDEKKIKKYADSAKKDAKDAKKSEKYAKKDAKDAKKSEKDSEKASDTAQASANTAVGASDTAQASATTAQASATTAQASATTAQASATTAQDSATTAQDSATTAQDSTNTALGASYNAQDSANTAVGAAKKAEYVKKELVEKGEAVLDNLTMEPFINSRIVAASVATNIKEGFNEDESAYDMLSWLKNLLEDTEDKKNVQKAIYRRKLAQSSEILAQDDNILSNILFDYMVEKEEGSNIEKVYKKLDAENKNKMRKIQINTYYTKAYKEYIYLLKITILLIAILIPILILNRIELLGKNYTLILIVSILLLGFLYIFYRLYILYMRDDINFDKFRVPYDRQAHQMYEEGTLSKKDSPLKGLGVTCIGDECCDASMIYDNLANKCVMQENFGNYFEKMNNMNNNSNINVVKQFDNFDNYRENFITSNNALKEKKNDLLAESLTNTRSTTFDKPNTRII